MPFPREFVWRHPECWAVALSAAAWLTLGFRAALNGHDHSIWASWIHWLLMVAAMMVPLTVYAIRITAAGSLWRRRHRAIFGFLIGYLGVWALAGLPLALLAYAFILPQRLDWAAGASIGFLVAALWLVTRWKALAASLCHRTIPLAPAGWRADRDCLRYGWSSGFYCLFNCWPFMLVCWLSAHSFLAMACGFAFGWVERYRRRPNFRRHSLALAAVSLGFAICAVAS